jgi:hypothetical protein
MPHMPFFFIITVFIMHFLFLWRLLCFVLHCLFFVLLVVLRSSLFSLCPSYCGVQPRAARARAQPVAPSHAHIAGAARSTVQVAGTWQVQQVLAAVSNIRLSVGSTQAY